MLMSSRNFRTIARTFFRRLLPTRASGHSAGDREQETQERFFEQRLVGLKCGDYEISVPEGHMLRKVLPLQPYRDLAIGLIARLVARKYPFASICDVGANVGDTAAIIATQTRNKLILIEASDYYFDLLTTNVRQLPNEKILRKVMISDGAPVHGHLHHWGGTARFEANSQSPGTPSMTLAEAADSDTRLVKIDTDGFDFRIIASSLGWFQDVGHPALFWENQITTQDELASSDLLFSKLQDIGYKYFVVWDDAGFHLVSTDSLAVLQDLNRYLFKVWTNQAHISVYNYDVLAVHEQDLDIYAQVKDWYRAY
jgi:FkbM family methyltransferase